MLISQKEFKKTVSQFTVVEDMRDELWGRCIRLLKDGYEIEACVLLLATWNFARFRFFMKQFDLKKFELTLKKINPIIDKLGSNKFENVDFNDHNIQAEIKTIYEKLKEQAEQTGATKIMALKNPQLFIMWDTEIRKIYGIDNKASGDDYLKFLKEMKNRFGHIKPLGEKLSLAKAIDEYNYVIAEKRRAKRRSLRGKKMKIKIKI